MAADAVRRSAQLVLALADPRRVLAPLRALDLPGNLVRRGFEKAWGLGIKIGHAAGKHLGQDFTFLTQIPAAVLRPVRAAIQTVVQGVSWAAQVLREIRAHESSDPQDLRERVAMRAGLIREVFSEEEEPLDVLRPVQVAAVLPDGRLYPLHPLPATPEAIQEAVCGLDEAIRKADQRNHGRYLERSPQSLLVAEAAFRAGHGLRPMDPEEPERDWPERLGRLHRQGWDLILDRSMDLADRAQRVLDARAESARREEMRRKPQESPLDEPRRGKPREPEPSRIQGRKAPGMAL